MIIRLLLLAALLTGCSHHAAARYAVSADNVSHLRTYRGQSTVALGPFTAAEPGRSEITCRGAGPVKTPDGEPFHEFIRKAFIADMTLAEIYAPTAPVTLTGRLDSIDFSSGMTDAGWDIAMTISSSNGKRLSVKERYDFKSAFDAITACHQTANAFMPAVQNLVTKTIRHPDFPALIR
jgi:hypothetical protein